MEENIIGTGPTCELIRKVDNVLGTPFYRYADNLTINEPKKALTAKAEFIPVAQESTMGKLWGKKKKEDKVYNEIQISIFRTELGKEVKLCQGTGNYIRFIEFENQIYWDRSHPMPTTSPMEKVLASDSRLRPEMELIAKKEYSKADK